MIPADVENAVAAEKIEIGGVIHVVEIRALRPCIDLVEPNHALRRHQRGVHVPLVQLIVFAQTRRDDFLQVKRHGATLYDLRPKRNRNAPIMAPNLDRLRARPPPG